MKNLRNNSANHQSHKAEESLKFNFGDRAAWHVKDFCHSIGISRTTFYKAVKAGSIRVVSIGGRTLVPASEVARLLGDEPAHRLE